MAEHIIKFLNLIVFLSAVDIISAIEFDRSGDHLATGDRGGRVVLFERTDTKDV
jgi:serine/threonine-protein phosphatase 2A regulatory subunit B